MRLFLPALAAVAVTALPGTAASAHYLWAAIEKNQVRFALLENANEAPNPRFETYVVGLAPRSGGKVLVLGSPRNGARYAALPVGEGIVEAERVLSVKERGGEVYLLAYHAKGAVSLAAAGTSTQASTEILARREGRTLIATLRQNQRPVPQNEILVQWPGEEEPRSVRTDANGEARINELSGTSKAPNTLNMQNMPKTSETLRTSGMPRGFVGIRAMVSEAKAGEAGGKKYASIHHWATLTFPVESLTTAKAAVKE